MDLETYLAHHGILGMKWGVRKEEKAQKRIIKKDNKWVEKHGDKIQRKAMKDTKEEMNKFIRNDLQQVFKTNGRLSSKTILEYNTKLAKTLNDNIGDIASPSGRVLRFVAKRGVVGVHQALADAGYDMNKVRNGVYTGGKVAYRNENLIDKGGQR